MMNLPKHVKNTTARIGNLGKRGWATVVALPASLAVAATASAQDDLGATALSAVSGLKSSVNGILMVLIAVVFLLVLFSYLKKAK
jgi:high-affinity nickel permease